MIDYINIIKRKFSRIKGFFSKLKTRDIKFMAPSPVLVLNDNSMRQSKSKNCLVFENEHDGISIEVIKNVTA